jgi:ribosomal protein L16/L10AE
MNNTHSIKDLLYFIWKIDRYVVVFQALNLCASKLPITCRKALNHLN